MDMNDVILNRRSIRKYKETEIPFNDLREILEAGIMAPNGMNLQPWHFIMIRDPEKLNECREIMSSVYQKFRPVLEERFSRNPHIVQETGQFLTTLGGSSAFLLAFTSRPEYDNSLVAVSGISAAVENMLLSAQSKGIGSCWITAPIVAKMDDVFRDRFAPDKGKLVACATFGYPDETPPTPPRRIGKYEII